MITSYLFLAILIGLLIYFCVDNTLSSSLGVLAVLTCQCLHRIQHTGYPFPVNIESPITYLFSILYTIAFGGLLCYAIVNLLEFIQDKLFNKENKE